MSPVFGTIGLAPTGMRCAEGEQVHQATIYVRHLVEGDIPSRGPDKRANRVRREKVMGRPRSVGIEDSMHYMTAYSGPMYCGGLGKK